MGPVPLPTPSTEPAVEVQRAYVVQGENVTVDDVRHAPTFVGKKKEAQLQEELEQLRPRLSPIQRVVTTPPPMTGVLDAIVHDRSTSHSDVEVVGSSIAKIDRGRIVLRECAAALSWDPGISVSFTSTPSVITITACATQDDKGTLIDNKTRCLLPQSLRMRNGLEQGDSVLLLASAEPLPHIQVIPLNTILPLLITPKEKE